MPHTGGFLLPTLNIINAEIVDCPSCHELVVLDDHFLHDLTSDLPLRGAD